MSEAENLRKTLERMATSCSVNMDLWQEHSTACLEAANALEESRADLAAEREAHELTRQQSADLLTQYCNERDAARKISDVAVPRVEAHYLESEGLRAELAAERERAEELKMMLKENGETLGEFVASNKEAWDRAHNAEARAAKLREALVKARNATGADERVAAFAAIDAVLKETGDRDE